MTEDIKTFEKVINKKSIFADKNNYFLWIYPFTNENINGYYSKLNLENKSILTVTSSGDHILNALLLGGQSVEAFDTNPLAKYYVELKIAAIKSLSLEEFILFFYNKNIIKKQKNYLNKETYYTKIQKYLSDKYKVFWDYVFKNYTSQKLYNSFLFTNDFLSMTALIKANAYLNEEGYNKLKIILENKTIVYHDINIKDLKELDKKFDIIILSNIPYFIDKIFKKDALLNLKNIINKIKKEDSCIMVNYYYNNLLNNSNKTIYNKNKVNKVFNLDEYEYIKIESSENLLHTSEKNNTSYITDQILISKNKK